MSIYAVIMAGGSGTRFWPLSRKQTPKQLLNIVGDTTMIQSTVARLQPMIPAGNVLVITTAALADETRKQLPMLKTEHIIAEPMGRDTAACVALAAIIVQKLDDNGTMILLPADQLINPADEFQKDLGVAVKEAEKDTLVTLGITPRFPATGYGYIEASEKGVLVSKVNKFVEKPNEEKAKEYINAGNFYWNSGIFIWRAAFVLDEMMKYSNDLISKLSELSNHWGTENFDKKLCEIYTPLEKISIDYALLEKAQNVSVVSVSFTWDDIGSWDALYDHLPKDKNENILQGNTVLTDSKNNMIISKTKQLISAVGIEDTTIVATDDAILICKKGKGQQVKTIVDNISDSYL